MTQRALRGPWRLAYRGPARTATNCPSTPASQAMSSSTVPGGAVAGGPVFRENILAVRDGRMSMVVRLWLDIDAEELASSPELVFHGADGDAEYYLNGRLVASANSLIEHRFELAVAARAGANEPVVHLRPFRPPAGEPSWCRCGR